MATLTDINTWWQTNVVPTVAQRLATFASFRLKSDAIPMNEVTGLSDALNSKANASEINNKVILDVGASSYEVEAGTMITSIWFMGGSAANIGVGTGEGLTDIFDTGELPEGGELPFDGNHRFREAATIYFTGVQVDTVIIIFKQ